MTSSITSYVEIYIWRARDKDGLVTTSSEGARHESTSKGGRVGHASLQVFSGNTNPVYISLWPVPIGQQQQEGQKERYAVLVPSLSKEISSWEGTKPDIIVRLYHLNTKKIIDAFNEIQPRILKKEIVWDWWMVNDTSDVTSPKHTIASCTSFVWTFLKIGGINESSTRYPKSWSTRGPKDGDFYKKIKCNLGQRFGGWFDGFPWTKTYFTPYALSLRVGSAAEAWTEDKKATIEIMDSDRVYSEKENSNSLAIDSTKNTMVPASIPEKKGWGWTATAIAVGGFALVAWRLKK